jgi:drug/metabolite transporter (DMT)-like permease
VSTVLRRNHALGRAALLQRRWAALSGSARGVLWMLLAGLGFSLMSATVKWLGGSLHPFQIAFFRCFFGLVIVLPFALRHGGAALWTGRPVLHLARALVGITAMTCGFYAVTHLPLADVTAVGFTKGMFMVVLAVLFLGERVRWRRWTATAVGFVGMLIMVRPGSAGFDPVMLVALLGASLAAVVVTLIRAMPLSERPVTLLFYFGLITTPVAFLPAWLVWQSPGWQELALLALASGLGVAGQGCAIRAHRAGEASIVAPFDYARLLFATALGFALFGDLPDEWTVVGATVIVASSLYIARRELRLGRTVSDRGPLSGRYRRSPRPPEKIRHS